MIDYRLTWKTHIDYVYSKLLKFTGIFYKLRSRLHSDVLKQIYFAFVYPVLLYIGIEIYANKNHINRLMILNNKILRITQNKPLRYNVTELYKNFNTLPLPELHKFQLLCLVHKINISILPL